MKRTAIIVMLLVLFAASVYAASEPAVIYKNIDFTFAPAYARYEGMGQAGTASSSRLESFYLNPAALAGKGFAISIPSVSMTVFNVNPMTSDENVKADFDAIQNKTADESTYIDLVQRYVGHLGSGHNLVAQVDTSMAVKFWHIGLGLDIQEKVHSVTNGSATIANVTLIPEANVAQTVSLGLPVIESGFLSLSVGASAHLVFKEYYKGIAANTVTSMMGGEDEIDILKLLEWDTPVMAGYAIPFDVGATLGLGKSLCISASATNLNGTYHMKSYSSQGDLAQEASKYGITVETDKPEDHVTNESVEFEIKTPWELNFGISFAPDWKFLRPVISADLVDMAEMVRDISKGRFRTEDLLLHLNAGAEISLLNTVKVRAGVNRGYMSVGAGLNIFIMQVDVAYGWREMGAQIGDKPVDALTVRINFGYDR